MSGAGSSFDPMMLMYPQQELEIQRRQMLANMLMQNQTPKEIAGHPTGPLSYGVDAVNRVLGAYELGKALDTQKQMYQGFGMSPQQPAPPQSLPGASATQSGIGLGALQEPQAQAAPSQQSQGDPRIAQAQMSPFFKVMMAKAFGAPEEYQSALMAANGDEETARKLIYGKYAAAGVVKGAPGDVLYGQNGPTAVPPAPPSGFGNVPDPTSPTGWRTVQQPGALPALAGSKAAEEFGKQSPEPVTFADGTKGYAYRSDYAGAPPALRTDSGPAVPAPSNGLTESGAQAFVKGMFPGAVISSGQRTPAHNAAVGGVPNSMHIPGQAVDFVLPKGMSFDQVKQQFAAAGVPTTELLNEGDHVHWGWGQKSSAPTSGPAPIQTDVQAAANKAAAGQNAEFSSLKANTDNLLQIIKDARVLNNKLPDSGMIPMEARAEMSRRMASSSLGDKGDLAANYDSWESLMNIKAINAIEQISKSGISRMDIPIVKAVKEAIIASADNTKAGRAQVLDQLEAMTRNNLAVAQNSLANLNQPGAQMPHAALTPSYHEPPLMNSPADAMKLPSGTRFKTPDGRVLVRP